MSEPSLDDWLWPVRIISNNSKFDKTSMKENAPTELTNNNKKFNLERI